MVAQLGSASNLSRSRAAMPVSVDPSVDGSESMQRKQSSTLEHQSPVATTWPGYRRVAAVTIAVVERKLSQEHNVWRRR